MKKSSIVIAHSLAWIIQYLVLFVMFSILINTAGTGWLIPDKAVLKIASILLPALLIPFYTFYFLWQGIVNGRNRWIWYILGLAVLLILPVLYLKLDDQDVNPDQYLKCFVLVGFISLLGFLFRGFFNGIIQAHERETIEKQQLENELNFLKGQISPHFLFNTLNNIDSLIPTDPETASRSLISLSDVMRYMIYKTSAGMVPLVNELENMENVIALYRLRYKKERSISYQLEGEDLNYRIPPMLLIPVVENAFKHYSGRHSDAGIKITVAVKESKLVLSCSNAFDPAAGDVKASGIGLQTLRRRLALLFPGNHELEIRPVSSIFNIRLNIPLIK